ncbi:MAG: hypothetical protein JWR85_4166 [Marmoricola sp.]|nr:hypothetical protein [Marmoricola sp.]
MATAAKRARKAKPTESSAANLIDGLKFVSIAQKEKGEPRQTHCILGNGWIVASDGGISAGCRIEDEIQAAPHTRRMIAALQKATGQISIVQLASGKLSIKGGKFSTLVPCLDIADMPDVSPDPQIALLTNEIKRGFAACAVLANEASPEPYRAGVLLQANSIVGTNGHALIEYWHGIDLPPGLMIPKASAMAVAGCPKNLVGFGFTDRSVTFHFEDFSFIKTQLFNDQFPDYARLLDKECNPWPIPPDFFTAIDTIEEFSDNGLLYFDNNLMKSSRNDSEGATYEVAGLVGGMGFNHKYLKAVQPEFKKAAFDPAGGEVLFFGDVSRGIVKGIDLPAEHRAEAQGAYSVPVPSNDPFEVEDDIPF